MSSTQDNSHHSDNTKNTQPTVKTSPSSPPPDLVPPCSATASPPSLFLSPSIKEAEKAEEEALLSPSTLSRHVKSRKDPVVISIQSNDEQQQEEEEVISSSSLPLEKENTSRRSPTSIETSSSPYRPGAVNKHVKNRTVEENQEEPPLRVSTSSREGCSHDERRSFNSTVRSLDSPKSLNNPVRTSSCTPPQRETLAVPASQAHSSQDVSQISRASRHSRPSVSPLKGDGEVGRSRTSSISSPAVRHASRGGGLRGADSSSSYSSSSGGRGPAGFLASSVHNKEVARQLLFLQQWRLNVVSLIESTRVPIELLCGGKGEKKDFAPLATEKDRGRSVSQDDERRDSSSYGNSRRSASARDEMKRVKEEEEGRKVKMKTEDIELEETEKVRSQLKGEKNNRENHVEDHDQMKTEGGKEDVHASALRDKRVEEKLRAARRRLLDKYSFLLKREEKATAATKVSEENKKKIKDQRNEEEHEQRERSSPLCDRLRLQLRSWDWETHAKQHREALKKIQDEVQDTLQAQQVDKETELLTASSDSGKVFRFLLLEFIITESSLDYVVVEERLHDLQRYLSESVLRRQQGLFL